MLFDDEQSIVARLVKKQPALTFVKVVDAP